MALAHYAVGIGLSLLLWAFCFSTGVVALIGLPMRQSRGEDEPIDQLVATGFGFAIVMLALFLLLAAHLFFGPLLIGALIVIALALLLLAINRTDLPSVRSVLRGSLAAAITPGWLIVLVVCLVLSAPAMLPPDNYDSTMYHFAYAFDWASAHRLTLDPYLRFPLAQFNIELLYAFFFALGFGDYVQFVTAAFFTITATGLVSLTSTLLRQTGASKIIAQGAALCTACVFITCPIVLRCIDVGLVDVPAGALLLAFGTAAVRAKSNYSRYALAMAAIGGAFIGIKLAFVPSLLLFSALIIWFGRTERIDKKRIAAYVAVLAVFSAPWFIRNIIVSGDPVDPIVNLAFHRPDPFWNQVDLDGQKGDLHRDIPLIANPIWLYLNPSDAQGAVSLSFCFLYVPVIYLIVFSLDAQMRKRSASGAILAAIVVFAMAQNVLVSNRISRYVLHYYALYLVVFALSSWSFFGWLSRKLSGRDLPWLQAASLVSILVLVLPPPVPIVEYNNVVTAFQTLGFGVRRPEAQLSKTYGYTEANDLATIVSSAKDDEKVLTVNFEYLAYFFRRKGVVSVGDWWGQGRLAELKEAIDSSATAAYLARLQIGAVMIRSISTSLTSVEEANLVSALTKAGFIRVTRPETDIEEYVKGDVLADAYKNGYPHAILAVTNGSIDFEEAFSHGTIHLDPSRHFEAGDRSVNIFPALDGDGFVNTITVISGNSISFSGLRTRRDTVLDFDVSKVFNVGTSAEAWVDVTSGSKARRVYSVIVPKATEDSPIWKHVTLSLGSTGRKETITFGASSIAGGGVGDWVAFARPILRHATFASGVADIDGAAR